MKPKRVEESKEVITHPKEEEVKKEPIKKEEKLVEPIHVKEEAKTESKPVAVKSTEAGAKVEVSGSGTKLTYFDGYGKGETIRMLLTHSGIEFEDVRI